jgi:hypothetical protein
MGFKGKLSKYFFFKWDYIPFISNSDHQHNSTGGGYLGLARPIDFNSENNNVSQYNFTLKKITLTFETNDEHQAKSYQNALRYNVITKLR